MKTKKSRLTTYEVKFDTLIVNAKSPEEAKELIKRDFKMGYYPDILNVKIWS